MATFAKKLIAAAALIAITAGSAQAACWTPSALTAAKVRDFEAMLRTTATRCAKQVPTIKASYDQFVRLSRPAFMQANTQIREHFAQDNGLVGSFSAYNQFLAGITGNYGAGVEAMSCTDLEGAIATATANGASATVIARLADENGSSPVIVGQRCSNRVTAANRSAKIQQVAIK